MNEVRKGGVYDDERKHFIGERLFETFACTSTHERMCVCVRVRVLVASIFKVNDDKREGGVCVVCSIRASDLVRVL